MIFNGSDAIDNDRGDFLVLEDHGPEGLRVTHQTETLEDALQQMANTHGGPQTLVRLVHLAMCYSADNVTNAPIR